MKRMIKANQRNVEIYTKDYNEKYKDCAGGFGGDATAAGEIYTLAEIKDYWNENNVVDPILEDYPDFDSWWRDTLNMYLDEVY